MLVEVTEIGFRIFEIGFLLHTGRTTQGIPRTSHVFTQGTAGALREAGRQRGAHTLKASTAISSELRNAIFVPHRRPQRHFRVRCSQHMQIGQRQAAARRAQHREPSHTVGRMRQRARQRQQILYHGTLAQRFNVDGAKAQPGCFQRRHNLAQMAAGAHQDRHFRRRIGLARIADDLRNAPCFRRTIITQQGMDVDRLSGQSLARRYRSSVWNRTQSNVFRGRHDTRECRIDPVDDAGLGTEICRQRHRMQIDTGNAFLARAQEQADFRFAKTVYGLHRITDGKHRAPVIRRPAERQLGDEVRLADGGVLEFVNQQMADTVIERKSQVRRLVLGAQRMQGALCHFREIHLTARLEHHF